MKNIVQHTISLVFLIVGTTLLSQTTVEISQPELELRDNDIVISYQILKSSNRDLFNIWIEVTNDNGDILNARSLRGDVGENIRGGGNRQIAWDYQKDVVTLDAGIYVQVFGEMMKPEIDPDPPVVTERPISDPVAKSGAMISKPSAILRSVAFPGWGLSAMNPGKPHWIKGVAGYGALASTFVFNRMAVENYNKYLDSSDQTAFNDYYDQAISQQNLSKISAYIAAGIWITDLVWTLLSDPGSSGYQSHNNYTGISMGTGYEPLSRAPMIAFRYSF